MKALFSLLLLPVKLITGLLALLLTLAAKIISLVGRLLAFIIGLALVTGGAMLSFTGVGAFLGIPLSIIGMLLIFRVAFPG